MIYLLSAFLGSVVSSIFVQNVPVAGSSAALFGFLGATISGLILNWQIYANKVVQFLRVFPCYPLPLCLVSLICSGQQWQCCCLLLS